MTKKRTRRQPPHGEYEDPLSNYDAPDYGDDFERSLCEDKLELIETQPCDAVGPDTPLREALTIMNDRNIAAVVVVEDERPVGILSERDVLMRIADRYDQIADDPIHTVMTRDPVVVNETDIPAHVLNQMSTGQFRHLPVVDVDGKLIGIIGSHRLLAYLQRNFTT